MWRKAKRALLSPSLKLKMILPNKSLCPLAASMMQLGAGQNIPGQNIPCHFFTPWTKHPTKICHPGQNIPCCFCHPGHNIPCCFCHPGHNIPCHFCHPGQNIPHSDCSFRVRRIWDLHLLLHVLAVNALVRLCK